MDERKRKSPPTSNEERSLKMTPTLFFSTQLTSFDSSTSSKSNWHFSLLAVFPPQLFTTVARILHCLKNLSKTQTSESGVGEFNVAQ